MTTNLSACLCTVFIVFGCLVAIPLFVVTKTLITYVSTLKWLWTVMNVYLWFLSSLYFIYIDVHYIYITAYLMGLSMYQYFLWSSDYGDEMYDCIIKKMNIAS
jgi:hypothetical protein